VNIELGAATFRSPRPIVIPLCHSDLAEVQSKRHSIATRLLRSQPLTVFRRSMNGSPRSWGQDSIGIVRSTCRKAQEVRGRVPRK
jgi:hypothetical protein